MLEYIIIIPVAILSGIFTCLYIYFTRNFKFWQKLGIPYVKPQPFVGNLKDCLLQKVNIGGKLQQIYNENTDKPYVGIFSFDKPILVIRDPQLLRNVLVKDSHNFIDHILTLNEKIDPIFGKILYALKDKKWHRLRTKLNPVFSSSKTKKMFYLMDKCGKELAECLDRATIEGSNIDVVEIMPRYTIDTIGSCAFGINGHCLEDPHSEFAHFVRKICVLSIRRGLAALTAISAPALTSLFKLKFLDDDVESYMRKTVWSTVEYREKNGIVRNDFLDCMMELRNRGKAECRESIQSNKDTTIDNTFQIDGDIFVAQAFLFIAAGFETSANALCYLTYEIALHPEVQHKLRAEILSVLKKHNGKLTYDGIQEMTYLDMVVAETLRKYPILPFLDRICHTEYEIPAPFGNGSVTLPACTLVFVPVLALHHDPTYYPEPEKFDPDRFTEENKNTRPKYTYLPFGEGQRMCIGIRFGMMQIKTALCHILPRFEVSPCKDTPRHIEFDPRAFEMKPNSEITLSFKRTNT